ncbi:hypothetical protein GOBAR_DD32551 [Gossypium barbadense]|nr:hypothetical protein GOBAR_DD32551 [Gossypium barbadense]
MATLIRPDRHISDAANQAVECSSGYREVSHYLDIPTHDRIVCPGRVYMDAILYAENYKCGTIVCIRSFPHMSAVVPLHMKQPGGSYPAAPIDSDPVAYYSPEPEPEQEPQSDPEQSQSHYGMPGPSDPYPQHHGTHSGSSSSMPNEPQDFSSRFATPPPVPNDDVGHRKHPQHDRRPPNRFCLIANDLLDSSVALCLGEARKSSEAPPTYIAITKALVKTLSPLPRLHCAQPLSERCVCLPIYVTLKSDHSLAENMWL